MTLNLAEKARLEQRQSAIEEFGRLYDTVQALRHPETGCPWDLKQNHRTLRKYMLEEAYEAVALMASAKGHPDLADELGDVLLQVLLNAQIAADDQRFSISDVIRNIDSKMKRRHPHVFLSHDMTLSSKDLRNQWADIKAAESFEKLGKSPEITQGIFAKVGKEAFPATIKARRIGEQASRISFDWEDPKQVWAHFISEVSEASEALNTAGEPDSFEAELGDVYFTLAQVCRHFGFDPENIAEGGNKKFLKRFALMESIAERQKIEVRTASKAVKEQLWLDAKAQEGRKTRPSPRRPKNTKK